MSNPHLAVVERQFDAFNSHDIDAIMSIYADDAEFFEFPSTLLFSGSVAVRDHFTTCFQEPNLNAYRFSTLVNDPYVITLLQTTRTFPEGRGRLSSTMIYEVCGDKIVRTWSFPGTKVLD